MNERAERERDDEVTRIGEGFVSSTGLLCYSGGALEALGSRW